MKLHSLDIQAFGPFAQLEHIDFSKLGDNPLFLIDGPTGAGKSSILHAICYALYGETTDEARKDVGVRCDNAKSDLLTELSLEFSIRGQHYRITRLPTQIRQTKRGDGFTEQKAQAHLRKVLSDGTEETLVTKKVSAAKDEIHKIVGLTAEQFRQVMVLPQGKFRELLLAKSDERQLILSTLFQTEIFKRIEQSLKEKSSEISREYNKFKEQINEALNEVFSENKQQLAIAISDADVVQSKFKQQKLTADNTKQVLSQQLKTAQQLTQAFSQKQQLQSQLSEHLTAEDNYQQAIVHAKLAEQAKDISPKWQTLEQVKQDSLANNQQLQLAAKHREQADQNVAANEQHLVQVKQQYAQRDTLLAQLNTLNSYTPILAEFAKLKDSATARAATLLQAQTKRQSNIDNLNELNERSKKGQLYIDSLQQKLTARPELLMLQQQLQQQNVALKQFESLTLKLNKQQHTIKQLNSQQQSSEQHYKQALTAANQLEMLWHSNQAAILAKTLKVEQACPVCGSTEHPEPAILASAVEHASKENVDAARELQSQSLALKNQADKVLAQAQEVLNQQSAQQQELQQHLGELAFDSSDNLNQQLQVLANNINELNTVAASLPAALDKLERMQKEFSVLEGSINELTSQIPLLTSDNAHAQANFANATQSLPEQYRDLNTLNSALSASQAQITKLDTDLQNAQTAMQQALTAQSNFNAKLEQLQIIEQQLTTRSQQLEQDWQLVLVASEFASHNDFIQACAYITRLVSLKQAITDFEQKRNDLSSKLALITEQLSGKQQPELSKLQAGYDEHQMVFKQVEQDWVQAQTQYSKLVDVDKKITRLETEQSENKQQYEMIGTLSAAASGKGRVRVSLERFVLGDLLDSVLAIASKRLYIMSKGQYQLVRQNEGEQKKNVTAGLDLAIDDAYTGKTRPVSTLSGGESFLASLALALGLSDVVQQRSGGIQLDTLFIDEGFGSLDQESLQLAIETLIDLQASGRTIGIISHVSELKEQMALRIDVQSTRDGSSIKVVA